MQEERDDYFWTSYVDLMTSLFFVVLVLFVMSFALFKKKEKEMLVLISEAKKIQEIRDNLETLMSDTLTFVPRPEYKRYELKTDVKFGIGKYNFIKGELMNFKESVNDLNKTGQKLLDIIKNLQDKKRTDDNFSDVSYLMVIEGRASDLSPENRSGAYINTNYTLSYNRSFNLYKFWKENGFDFGAEQFHDIIDLQISGNGIGGIGRYQGTLKDEEKNQSFIIHIIPKLGTSL